MIKFELSKDAGLLVVEPREALTAEDFQVISQTVDPYITENGKLNMNRGYNYYIDGH